MSHRWRHAWNRRFTLRARLTLSFTLLVACAGIVMIVIVNVYMRIVPVYVSVVRPADMSPESATLPTPSTTPPPAGIPALTVPGSSPNTLTSAVDILDTAFSVSAVVLGVLIAAGAFVSWHLAGRLLRPLQHINQAAARAGAGDLTQRVALSGPEDEVRALSRTFDDMLGRLDLAFQAHQRFAANASHELRTPLATTQTLLEVGLGDPNATAEELREIAERVLEANRRNAETVEALLDLAETGERQLRLRPVELRGLLAEAIERSLAEATERSVIIETLVPDGDTVVLGDQVLLRQAFCNLVSNAVRHNLDGGHLRVELRRDQATVQVEVSNSGAVLTQSRIDELTEPFARGEGRVARADGRREGHGLGLAIVTNVVAAHDAVLTLWPRPGGGLSATVTFDSSLSCSPQEASALYLRGEHSRQAPH